MVGPPSDNSVSCGDLGSCSVATGPSGDTPRTCWQTRWDGLFRQARRLPALTPTRPKRECRLKAVSFEGLRLNRLTVT